MQDAYYTIRLRYTDQHGEDALIVEDRQGDAYVFARSGLYCRMTGVHTLARLTPTLLRLGWATVPEAAPYSLHDLTGLLRPAAA